MAESIYESLGVRTVIDAWGTVTALGGSLMAPEVLQAMQSAAGAFVDMSELHTAAGRRIADLLGVEACCVQPGDIQTGFTAARQKIVVGDDIYNGRISRSVAGMEKDETTGMKPEQAGAFVCHVATKKGVRPVNTIGLSYKFFCVLQKLLPAKTLNWLVGVVYAR